MTDTFMVQRMGPGGKMVEYPFPVEFRQRIVDWEADPDAPMIQVAFHDMPAKLREFLMTGITPEQFKAMAEEEPR